MSQSSTVDDRINLGHHSSVERQSRFHCRGFIVYTGAALHAQPVLQIPVGQYGARAEVADLEEGVLCGVDGLTALATPGARVEGPPQARHDNHLHTRATVTLTGHARYACLVGPDGRYTDVRVV